MPELPDVELYKRHLDATCRGRRIRDVVVSDTRVLAGISASELHRALAGTRIAGSRRHGKHLLVELEGNGLLALHFGMNGALQHFIDGEEDPPYDRVRLDFADGHHLAYVNPRRIGEVALASDAASFVAAHELGPDALDPAFDFAALAKAVAGSRRDVKSLLMDQSTVAGIGNIYSDEILFQARLHPRTRTGGLDRAARRRLFEAMKSVLETAIASGAGAERLVDRLPHSFLLPQRKKGGHCPRCGGPLATEKFAGRTGYYCLRCQKEAG
jgi:formamidopyrimidine-DNA glycosylase